MGFEESRIGSTTFTSELVPTKATVGAYHNRSLRKIRPKDSIVVPESVQYRTISPKRFQRQPSWPRKTTVIPPGSKPVQTRSNPGPARNRDRPALNRDFRFRFRVHIFGTLNRRVRPGGSGFLNRDHDYWVCLFLILPLPVILFSLVLALFLVV